MSIPRKYCFIYILIGSLAVLASQPLFGQTDSTKRTDSTQLHPGKKAELSGHQLLLGVDLFHPIVNHFQGDTHGFELECEYYTHNEYYLTLEGGSGGADVNYSNLQYTTTNNFLRFGFNKSLLARYTPKDWDMMFIGLRAAGSIINRSGASYVIVDSTWGNYAGRLNQGSTFAAFWAELTAGMRVEMAKNLLAGWNIRGKFMLNGKSFVDLSPQYIAGYGRGDKNAVFDFDLYVSYAIRWDRKNGAAQAAAKPPANN